MSYEVMSPGAIAERRRIHEALRRIAARYRDTAQLIEEVAIRRAIEELFDAPIEEECR